MNPDKQRIAIAEACGWKFVCDPAREWDYAENPKGGQCNRRFAMDPANKGPLCVPDYLNDLNAMHEAEKMLTLSQRVVYGAILAERFNDSALGASFDAMESAKDESCRWSSYSVYLGATTTAAQRAEAFLRAIGKWEDEP